MELSNQKLKKLLIFQKELARPKKQKWLILVFKQKNKTKKFLVVFLVKKQNFLN